MDFFKETALEMIFMVLIGLGVLLGVKVDRLFFVLPGLTLLALFALQRLKG